MLRSKSYARGITTALAAAALALPMVVGAQAADNRPVVVVFTFDNNAIGAGRADFDGIRTGVQDLLITDMASNAKIRLVDRAHIAEIQAEQNMVKSGAVDPQTAVRLGKILGAQYAVTGGWTSDAAGKAILTCRTIDIEIAVMSARRRCFRASSRCASASSGTPVSPAISLSRARMPITQMIK